MSDTEVVSWEEKLAQEAKDVAKLERPPITKIGFRSGVMTYMGEAVPDNELECIIAAYGFERVLYLSKYDPDNIVPPDCYALSSPQMSDSLAPDSNVPKPQHETCEGCPHDEWGSGSGRGKSCGERRRLIVLPKSVADNPEKVATAEMAMMSIPVTSIKNWGKYINSVAARTQRPYWAVLTKVMLKPDPKTQFKVYFEEAGLLSDNLLGAIQSINESAMQVALQPYDMSGQQEDKPKKKSKKAKY